MLVRALWVLLLFSTSLDSFAEDSKMARNSISASHALRNANKSYDAALAKLDDQYKAKKDELLAEYQETLLSALREAAERGDKRGINLINEALQSVNTVEETENRLVSNLKKQVLDLSIRVKQYKDAIGPVVAVLHWGHRGRKWAIEVLLEDGQTLSNRTWKLENGVLVFHMPSSHAPDGAWIDTLNFSEDRREITGTNQTGKPKFKGKVLLATPTLFETLVANSD